MPGSMKPIGVWPSMEYMADDGPTGSSRGTQPYQLRETPKDPTSYVRLQQLVTIEI